MSFFQHLGANLLHCGMSGLKRHVLCREWDVRGKM